MVLWQKLCFLYQVRQTFFKPYRDLSKRYNLPCPCQNHTKILLKLRHHTTCTIKSLDGVMVKKCLFYFANYVFRLHRKSVLRNKLCIIFKTLKETVTDSKYLKTLFLERVQSISIKEDFFYWEKGNILANKLPN